MNKQPPVFFQKCILHRQLFPIPIQSSAILKVSDIYQKKKKKKAGSKPAIQMCNTNQNYWKNSEKQSQSNEEGRQITL